MMCLCMHYKSFQQRCDWSFLER